MKNNKYLITSLVFVSLFSCSQSPVNTENMIKSPGQLIPQNEIYQQTGNAEYNKYLSTVESFSSTFSESCIKNFAVDGKKNLVVSPISAYSTLALASVCTGSSTSSEILGALKTDKDTLLKNYKRLYSDIELERHAETYFGEGKRTYKSHISNAVWLDSSVDFNKDTLDVLGDNFYSYSFKENFVSNNKKANKDISSFINEETDGLLNVNLNADELTRFVLLNCFYLMDLWNYDGSDIALDKESCDFISGDGTVETTNLMYQGYRIAKIYKDEEFTSFYAYANAGTNVYFLLPNEGYKAEEIMKADNINKALNASYYGVDEENKIIYHTSCSFPSYEAEIDKDIIPVVQNLGVQKLFNDPDFTPFCKTDIEISQIKHVAKLKVDRKGIEGASVVAMVGAGAVGPRDGYTDVYERFVVNKSFGFVVESRSRVQAFTGIVNSINKL